MLQWLFEEAHFTHVLAALVLLSRVGDLVSTLLVTPTLELEANPLARRFRRVTFTLGLAIAVVPYYSTSLGVMVLVPSLLVTSSNLSRAWIARALGEQEVLAFVMRAAARSSPVSAAGFLIAAALPMALLGASLLVLSGGPESWGYYFAWGILMYAGVMAVYPTRFALKLIRRVRQNEMMERTA
jgi:hypothetical protein